MVHLLITQMFHVRRQKVIVTQMTGYKFWCAVNVIGWILSYSTQDIILGVLGAIFLEILSVYVTFKHLFDFRKSFPDVYVHNFYQYWTCVGARELYVAELDREPVGCCGYVRLNDDTAELKRLVVDRRVARQGIGRQLVKHVIDRCQSEGHMTLRLTTTESETAAQALYESIGFYVVKKEGQFLNTCELIS